jgi:hypothetical protein
MVLCGWNVPVSGCVNFLGSARRLFAIVGEDPGSFRTVRMCRIKWIAPFASPAAPVSSVRDLDHVTLVTPFLNSLAC